MEHGNKMWDKKCRNLISTLTSKWVNVELPMLVAWSNTVSDLSIGSNVLTGSMNSQNLCSHSYILWHRCQLITTLKHRWIVIDIQHSYCDIYQWGEGQWWTEVWCVDCYQISWLDFTIKNLFQHQDAWSLINGKGTSCRVSQGVHHHAIRTCLDQKSTFRYTGSY